jgi:hypothetical protein
MSATPIIYEDNAVAVDATSAQIFSRRWIIGAREDLLWFFAPALLCYALLALYARGNSYVPLLFAGVFVLLDTPHVFATYTRTYFDREERGARRRLLAGALALFLVGPAAVIAGQGARFFAFAAVWAYYHQIKQHYGFAVIYKIKNRDLAPIDNALDRLLISTGFVSPFVAFVARNTNVLARLPASLKTYAALVPAMLLIVTLVCAVAWLARQLQRLAQGEPLNAPKLLLLLTTLPLYWIIMFSAATHQLALVVLLTAPLHSLQYHRLVWFHNRKYATQDSSRALHGAAHLINRRLIFYLAFIIALSLNYHALRRVLLAQGGHAQLWTELLLAFILGHLLVHFYLDSKIWRVRRDPSVGRSLHMAESD